jgi:hypothetical protein
MILREGEKIPFGYGIVGLAPEYFNSIEVQPIPFHWIKRWWYQQIHNFKLKDWEKQLMEVRLKAYKEGYANARKEQKTKS